MGSSVRGMPLERTMVVPLLRWKDGVNNTNSATSPAFDPAPTKNDIIIACASMSGAYQMIVSCTGFAFSRLLSFASTKTVALFLGRPIPGASSFGTTLSVTTGNYPEIIGMLYRLHRPEQLQGNLVGSTTATLGSSKTLTVPVPSPTARGRLAIGAVRTNGNGPCTPPTNGWECGAAWWTGMGVWRIPTVGPLVPAAPLTFTFDVAGAGYAGMVIID